MQDEKKHNIIRFCNYISMTLSCLSISFTENYIFFQYEPTVYDPRLDQPRGGNVDVFELNRPRAHRRQSADSKNLNEFNDLKLRK